MRPLTTNCDPLKWTGQANTPNIPAISALNASKRLTQIEIVEVLELFTVWKENTLKFPSTTGRKCQSAIFS